MTRIASAPARINLLGEHVDHQGGTVLPVAINLRTNVTYTAGDSWSFSSEGHPDDGPWTRYVRGVIEALEEAGAEPRPGRLEIASTIPAGRGLASSAALEVAIAGVLSDLTPLDLARLCRKAENEKLGVPCGFMDQAVAACAIEGHVCVIDCDLESFYHLPLPETELLLFDTGIARDLADTPYAERRREAATPGTDAARHVDEERARVEDGVALLDKGDMPGFGYLVSQGHVSLRDLVRCSLPEIDALVARLWETPGVFGARLIGAGWGGTVLALVEPGTRLEGGRHVLSDDGLYRLA